jgi:hypothetical protein
MKITPFIPHCCEVSLLNNIEGTLLKKKEYLLSNNINFKHLQNIHKTQIIFRGIYVLALPVGTSNEITLKLDYMPKLNSNTISLN